MIESIPFSQPGLTRVGSYQAHYNFSNHSYRLYKLTKDSLGKPVLSQVSNKEIGALKIQRRTFNIFTATSITLLAGVILGLAFFCFPAIATILMVCSGAVLVAGGGGLVFLNYARTEKFITPEDLLDWMDSRGFIEMFAAYYSLASLTELIGNGLIYPDDAGRIRRAFLTREQAQVTREKESANKLAQIDKKRADKLLRESMIKEFFSDEVRQLMEDIRKDVVSSLLSRGYTEERIDGCEPVFLTKVQDVIETYKNLSLGEVRQTAIDEILGATKN